MKKLLGFFAGVLLAGGLLWLFIPAPNSAQVDRWWAGLSDSQLEEHMADASIDELQNFVNYTNHEQLPVDFVYPAHIVNAKNRDEAMEAVKARFPQFTVDSREEYDEAIRSSPVEFRAYAHERTAVRVFFNLKSSGRLQPGE